VGQESPPRPGPLDSELREQAEACTGGVVRERRILEIECRYLGADRCVRVGQPGTLDGTVVEAIFQLGRDVFTIHHSDADETLGKPVVLRHKDVYSVTEFE
jgi:hypothetical protein